MATDFLTYLFDHYGCGCSVVPDPDCERCHVLDRSDPYYTYRRGEQPLRSHRRKRLDPVQKGRRRRQQAEREEGWRRDRRDRRRAKQWGGMPGSYPYMLRAPQTGTPWKAWRVIRNGR